MSITKERWAKLCQKMDAPDAAHVFDTHIEPRYSEPHRSYHTLSHIEECIRLFDSVAVWGMFDPEAFNYLKSGTKRDLLSLEVALWFHDVVYDPTRSDNEEKSAEYMEDLLERFDVDREILADAADLINLTKGHEGPLKGRAARYMLDIDLSILGEEPGKYWAFEHGIRQEYSSVPQEVYNPARIAILSKFKKLADTDELYKVKLFRGVRNNQARQNLTHAIAYLRSMPFPR